MTGSPAEPVLQEPQGIRPAALGVRTGTAALYGIAVVLALLAGTLPTAILFGAMAALSASEFYSLQRREARLPNEFIGSAAAAAMPLAAALRGLPGTMSVVTGLVAIAMLWHTLIRRVSTADTAQTIFGSLYTGFLLSYLVLIRDLTSGLVLSLALVVSVWVSDVAAYLIGSTFGRHKLAPHISPKKSWEGVLAGVLACLMIWLAVPALFETGVSLPRSAAIGLAVAISSVIGDLAESRMKREAGVKDSGATLPGHGGFLDRLDSLILACLVAYWLLRWSGVS